jgi:hypothetical protein
VERKATFLRLSSHITKTKPPLHKPDALVVFLYKYEEFYNCHERLLG